MAVWSSVQSVQLSNSTALAVCTAEIQVFAIFAALPPVLFILAEHVKQTRREHELRWAAVYASSVIEISVVGIFVCLYLMTKGSVDAQLVLLPILLMIIDFAIFVGYLFLQTLTL